MFGGSAYRWVGILIFLLFAAINVIIWLLRNKPELSYAIAWTLALYFLVYKIAEFSYYQIIGEHMNIPVELSSLSYFIFGIFSRIQSEKARSYRRIFSGTRRIYLFAFVLGRSCKLYKPSKRRVFVYYGNR